MYHKYSQDLYNQAFKNMISNHINTKKSEPFFIYFATQAPHKPTDKSPLEYLNIVNNYNNGMDEIRQGYAATVYGMDLSIQYVVQVLQNQS